MDRKLDTKVLNTINLQTNVDLFTKSISLLKYFNEIIDKATRNQLSTKAKLVNIRLTELSLKRK
jgi:hypothetical protein